VTVHEWHDDGSTDVIRTEVCARCSLRRWRPPGRPQWFYGNGDGRVESRWWAPVCRAPARGHLASSRVGRDARRRCKESRGGERGMLGRRARQLPIHAVCV
jgi:hypothetical protein